MKQAFGFVFGWAVELAVLPFGVVTLAALGAINGAWQYLRDVGFIARNVGDWR